MRKFLLCLLVLGFNEAQAQSCTTTFSPDPPNAGGGLAINSTCTGVSLPATINVQIGSGAPMNVSCTSVFGQTVCSQNISVPAGAANMPIYAAVDKAGTFYGFKSSVALAIALSNFETLLDSKGLNVSWVVANNDNVQGFTIERNVAGVWQTLANVEAHDALNYSQQVKGLFAGIHQLRLVGKSTSGDRVLKTFDVFVELPSAVALSAAYPNPFSTEAAIDLTVAQTQAVKVLVFDALGRTVATIFEGTLTSNQPYQFKVDALNLVAGTYILQVKGDTFSESRTLNVVK